MKKIITCTLLPIVLGLYGQLALAIGYQHGSFPDELSAEGLPQAIPCTMASNPHFRGSEYLACTWLTAGRTISEWDPQQGRTVSYPNKIQGHCRKGTCRLNGKVIGFHPTDTSVILSIGYYVSQSSDGKPVAYLTDTGPGYEGEAVSYAQAGQMLVELYENSGINDQRAIQAEFSKHYEGGWEQFQADLNGGTASASTDPEQCLNAWIKAFRDDVGEDAMIVGEQLNEWKGWCSKGKLP